MNPISDYHMHTPLCGHAVGQPEEYAQHAIDIGLKEIGFSDHAPLVAYPNPRVSMSFEQLPGYLKMIEEVRDRFADQLTIKIALEADFILGCENKSKELLKGYTYDYIIGSVHFMDAWCFDNPEEVAHWDEVNVDEVYHRYYGLLRQCAESKMFDIMAHVDLVKKFGHRAKTDMTEEIRHTAEVFKKTGMVIEINTSGLRKPAKEMYPAPDALKIYRAAGIPLTFGSDAHNPKDVGSAFNLAADLAKSAGYKEYVTFKQRKIERSIKL